MNMELPRTQCQFIGIDSFPNIALDSEYHHVALETRRELSEHSRKTVKKDFTQDRRIRGSADQRINVFLLPSLGNSLVSLNPMQNVSTTSFNIVSHEHCA